MVQISRILPDIEGDEVLLVKCNYKSITAQIEGEQIYYSLPAEIGMVKTDLGHYIAMIPLEEEYSEKEIVLNIEERASGYNSDVKYIHLTTAGQYGFHLLVDKAVALILSIVMMMCSLLSIVVWFAFWFKKGIIPAETYNPLLWISLFSASLGMWIGSGPHIWAVATGAFATSGIFNYLSLSLLPVALLGILKSICTKKLESLRWIVIVAKLLVLGEWILFLSGAVDLSSMLLFLQGSCVAALGVFVFFVIWKRECFMFGRSIRYGTSVVLLMAVIGVINYAQDRDWMAWALGAVIIILFSVLVSTLSNVYQVIKKLSRTKEYKEFALTDIMTGLQSRYAYTIFEAKYKMGRLPEDLCLLFLDINELKRANDTWGHVAGDEMIVGASKCIQDAFGDVADCFRMGGDEFLVAMRIEEDEVHKRIHLFEKSLNQWKGTYVNELTVSLGMVNAKMYPKMNFDELLRAADKEMYRQKSEYNAKKEVLES